MIHFSMNKTNPMVVSVVYIIPDPRPHYFLSIFNRIFNTFICSIQGKKWKILSTLSNNKFNIFPGENVVFLDSDLSG